MDHNLLHGAVFCNRCIVILFHIHHIAPYNHRIVIGLQSVGLIKGSIENKGMVEKFIPLHLLIEHLTIIGRPQSDGKQQFCPGAPNLMVNSNSVGVVSP